MAQQLKHMFNADTVRSIAEDLKRAWPAFPDQRFVRSSLERLEQLELLARGWHVAEVMHQTLPASFPEAAAIVVASFGPENVDPELTGFVPFRYMPHAFYLAKYGLEHPEESLAAQYELTKRFSAEFSIRGLLERHPELTLGKLAQWACDPNVHVRRLVSEGTRPRLPWAPRLRRFQEDPGPTLALLELLKDDPERYVQRSVANHLNDIAKDHPHIALDVCRRWLEDAGPGRKWIVSHALRSLVKAGNPQALALMGAGEPPRVKVALVSLGPPRLSEGETGRFRCSVQSTSTQNQSLVVDFAVHFVKASGKTAAKVFKLTRLELHPGQSAELSGRVSFRPMTTRKHYPGEHRVELQVNGVAFPLGAFNLQ